MTTRTGEAVAGVDGVPGGWVVAVVEAGGAVSWHACADAAEVLARTAGCAAVGVDVPIGLPAAAPRECDLLARRRLGRARSSVFLAPVRAVLAAGSHPQACEVSRAAAGAAISIQAWGIVPKIREWDAAEFDGDRVLEVHPEVAFRAMAPGTAFERKKNARGAGQRIAALRGFADAGAALAGAPASAGVDDALDALACAWTARRWAAGEAEQLGGDRDPVSGRRMRIVV
ncbi:DUF429 domain-containing protein [Actinokineospora bangkokensis]|uniref:DUF429 domain-containing protein n=1 Tax=Actinokineospora bangkokensis TaxID=1193682 RepID=A0A1Q9LC67_9PSEU|nr:DUF429 domain-containing protein [Actinokineospora bangkokensis]OLR89620.1 hypothetical protein BJP25_05760 [Actinokineospora bangkokensis]